MASIQLSSLPGNSIFQWLVEKYFPPELMALVPDPLFAVPKDPNLFPMLFWPLVFG